MLKTKLLWMIIAMLCMGIFSACWPEPAATPTPTPTLETPVLKTTLGELAVKSARLTDVANGLRAQPGQKYLLVTLSQPDLKDFTPETFPLEAFQQMIQANSGEIYVATQDGARVISTMAGWVDDAFVMGFVTTEGGAYTLYWPDNVPFALPISGE